LVHRRTEPVEKSIKGFAGFSNSFSTLLSLPNRNCSSLSLVFWKKNKRKKEDDLHLQPFSSAVAGHPTVAAPPPKLHKIAPFSKLNTYFGILFPVEYISGLKTSKKVHKCPRSMVKVPKILPLLTFRSGLDLFVLFLSLRYRSEKVVCLNSFSGAVAGHPRVATPSPELHKIAPFSKLNTYLGILFPVEYISGLKTSKKSSQMS